MSWEMVRLEDLTENGFMIDGDWIESKDQDPSGDIRLLQLADIGEGYFINKSNRFINRETSEKLKCTFLKKNDILIARMPDPIGRACLFPFEAENSYVTVVDVCVMRTKKEIDRKYVTYAINSPDFRNKIASQITGTTRLRISGKKLKDLQIPLPPFPIQKRIAEILDAADALKRKDQALLKKYDELAQAIFIDMFGDPDRNPNNFSLKDLSSICIEVVDCPHSTPIHTEEITNYPCIRTSEMKNGKIVWNKMKYLNYENYLIRVKRLTPKAGDIVYAREGTYGEAIILPEGYEFALGQRTMLLRLDPKKCDNYFICHFINSDFVYKQAKRKNMGSTVGHVNVADVKKFQILLPPLELQEKFGDILKLIHAQITSISKKYLSEELFQTLLQKAFKGELVN